MHHMGSRNILSTRIPLIVKTQKSHHEYKSVPTYSSRAKASAGENGTTESYCVITRECVGTPLTDFSRYISRVTRVARDIAQVAATLPALQNLSISTRQRHIHFMFDYKSFSINCYTYAFVKNPRDWNDSTA